MSEAPEWKVLAGPEIDEGLRDNLEQLDGLLGDFQDALAAAREVAQTAEQLMALLQTNNPLVVLLDAIAIEIEAFIDDFLKTGVYFLPVLPGPATTEFFRPFPTASALEMISRSLTDRLDSERPQSSTRAGYGALIALGGANTFFDFVSLIESFRRLFGDQSKWGRLADLFSNFELADVKPGRGFRQSQGEGWNWTSLRLEEFREVEEALLTAKAFVRSLRISSAGIISDLISLVEKRLRYYLDVANKIINFLEFLVNLANFAANVSYLPIGKLSGGVKQLQADVINSRNQPGFEYAIGFMIVGLFPAGVDDEGEFLPFKNICTLFGASLDSWEGLFQE